jgi:N-acetylglucosaminyldiphosphoundecaprenol N-acetyl-beta-D-mannosaminyltransferase
VSSGAAEVLVRRYPGLRIVGRRNGYFQPEEVPAIVDEINASGAKILFVALGSPRQERWIAENLPRLSVHVIQGIGGTLDTLTGHVKRAPRAFQKMHLEWFYRLASDPRRLRRQMNLPRFAAQVIRERLRGTR